MREDTARARTLFFFSFATLAGSTISRKCWNINGSSCNYREKLDFARLIFREFDPTIRQFIRGIQKFSIQQLIRSTDEYVREISEEGWQQFYCRLFVPSI